MQVDTGELPLALRRSQQEIKYSVKVKSTDGHPAKSVTDFHWTTVGGLVSWLLISEKHLGFCSILEQY